MNPYILLSEAATEVSKEIPDRSATMFESMQLIGEGWLSIFIVILFMIGVILCLNKVFNK